MGAMRCFLMLYEGLQDYTRLHRAIRTQALKRTDSEIHLFSHWAIMTRATGRTDSEIYSFSHWAIKTVLLLFGTSSLWFCTHCRYSRDSGHFFGYKDCVRAKAGLFRHATLPLNLRENKLNNNIINNVNSPCWVSELIESKHICLE